MPPCERAHAATCLLLKYPATQTSVFVARPTTDPGAPLLLERAPGQASRIRSAAFFFRRSFVALAMRQLSRRRSSAYCGILPRRGFTCLGEDYIERVVCSGAPRGASTVAQLHPCGSSNCFRASLGLAIGKYVHNFLQCGLQQGYAFAANRLAQQRSLLRTTVPNAVRLSVPLASAAAERAGF